MLVGDGQHHCCGELVAVGDAVTWRLRPDLDRDRLRRTCRHDAGLRQNWLDPPPSSPVKRLSSTSPTFSTVTVRPPVCPPTTTLR